DEVTRPQELYSFQQRQYGFRDCRLCGLCFCGYGADLLAAIVAGMGSCGADRRRPCVPVCRHIRIHDLSTVGIIISSRCLLHRSTIDRFGSDPTARVFGRAFADPAAVGGPDSIATSFAGNDPGMRLDLCDTCHALITA